MCGRYALHLRPSEVRERLAEHDMNMPADEAPDDDDPSLRHTYNFAPGNTGLIYRAVHSQPDSTQDSEPSPKRAKTTHSSPKKSTGTKEATKYKLQGAKWGLIPFWTKRAPDYSSQLRTINCRDDSLSTSGGMWNTMKQRKRCVVVAEGFYEWYKNPSNPKDKTPHYTKRKDGQLMCFAGLYDVVRYEGTETDIWTYTVITTDSNKQLKFLHDRMPVILEPGSGDMADWLDPARVGWDKELQGMLKPFEGELECYAVDKGVGKVGNNSALFVVPVDSKANPKNIANFFGGGKTRKEEVKSEKELKQEPDEKCETVVDAEGTEDNAPLPKPSDTSTEDIKSAVKHEPSDDTSEIAIKSEPTASPTTSKRETRSSLKRSASPVNRKSSSPQKKSKPTPAAGGRKMRSAVSNDTVAKTPTKEGNARITAFFGK
ncbi:hypothetical protein B0A48_15821 [Cryoendolithus antarcticus]|uniref:DUF159 domain protein n=1 Tax=Cryoendolithus antarcticus TaxID=1507870 RepID=A0A1V8SHK0_9PEZI|nr:hypothetical protein B0A48_15821 [Cryoendolithus antarcticus]